MDSQILSTKHRIMQVAKGIHNEVVVTPKKKRTHKGPSSNCTYGQTEVRRNLQESLEVNEFVVSFVAKNKLHFGLVFCVSETKRLDIP